MDLLQSDHIRLRPVEISDLDFIYQLENNTANWVYGNQSVPLSRFQIEQYIIGSKNDFFEDKQLRLIICDSSGDVCGMADLFDLDIQNRRAAIGILIAESSREKGLGKHALSRLLAYADAILGLHQVFCSIDADNKPSLRLFSEAGFVKAGKLKSWRMLNRQWKDVVLLQKILE